MKVLENLRRTMESINSIKTRKHEDGDCAEIFEKYKDIPRETLEAIIADVKSNIGAKTEDEDITDDELIVETDEVDVKPAEGKPVDEPHKTQITELDASEDDGTTDKTLEDFYTEENEDDVTEDELIISEEDEEKPSEDEEKPEEINEEDEDDDFDVYEDELDIVESDEEDKESSEKEEEPEEPKEFNEGAEKIDLDIPEEDNSDNAADKAAKEIKNESGTASKAAIANKDNKGAFSSDIDALTSYLDSL